MPEASANFVGLSADVVAAYVSHNSVTQSDLPNLIASVHNALRDAATGKAEPQKVVLEPPVSVKKSITPNHLISMEDGRPYKSLKRHLTARGLTPHSSEPSHIAIHSRAQRCDAAGVPEHRLAVRAREVVAEDDRSGRA